jgi:hypothetical protein
MRWLDSTDLQFAFENGLSEGRVERAHLYFYTCNLSLSRKLVRDAGGFNEAFPYPALEDSELAMRLCRIGFLLDYRPSALAWNARPMSLEDFCQRMALVGESTVILRSITGDADDELESLPIIEPRWRTVARWCLKGVASLVPIDPVLEMHYKSAIWQSQIRGIRRGYERVSAWHDSSHSTTQA